MMSIMKIGEREVDYNDKIVSFEGKKAKVVDQYWDFVSLVLQKNWKYPWWEKIEVKKNLVDILDKRKHPERYNYTEEQKEVVNSVIENIERLSLGEVILSSSIFDEYERNLNLLRRKKIDTQVLKNTMKSYTTLAIGKDIENIESWKLSYNFLNWLHRVVEKIEKEYNIFIDSSLKERISALKNKIQKLGGYEKEIWEGFVSVSWGYVWRTEE